MTKQRSIIFILLSQKRERGHAKLLFLPHKVGNTRKNLTTCQQDAFATGLWQACQQVAIMMLLYQVATRLSLTTC